VSYHAQDPSWDTAGSARPLNLIGYPGSYCADLLLQAFGLAAFLFPVLTLGLAWKWIRSEEVQAPVVKIVGTVLLLSSLSAVCSFPRGFLLFGGAIRPGGVAGLLLADWLLTNLNLAGSIVLTATTLIVSVYLVSSFTMSKLGAWFARPIAFLRMIGERWSEWREARRKRRIEKAKEKAAREGREGRKSGSEAREGKTRSGGGRAGDSGGGVGACTGSRGGGRPAAVRPGS
jgi:S-DNA-T family DNA segregation ATPase FtsK/SpoIIIE